MMLDSTVSVLSALVRLNLDPRAEAAELVALGRSAAGVRLSLLLSRCREEPRLGQDHQAVAHDLTRLLPDRKTRMKRSGNTTPKQVTMSWGTLLAILAIVYMLIQTIFPGASGSDE
ncbi:MAG: hypothetical protein ACNA7M_15745 [Roseovarius sp.]